MNIADEIQKLQQLHQSGALTDDEFSQAKATLIKGPSSAPDCATVVRRSAIDERYLDEQTKQWAMFLHLSLLAGFVLPIAGLVIPIVIWQLKKNELPGIEVHGKNVANWIVSMILYGVLSVLLIVLIIGIPLLIALGIVGVVFPIIGAIKAGNGEVWRYPMSISFFE